MFYINEEYYISDLLNIFKTMNIYMNTLNEILIKIQTCNIF